MQGTRTDRFNVLRTEIAIKYSFLCNKKTRIQQLTEHNKKGLE